LSGDATHDAINLEKAQLNAGFLKMFICSRVIASRSVFLSGFKMQVARQFVG
jgi:hypothetical protein